MIRAGAVVARLVVLLGLTFLTFAVLQGPARETETGAATWLLRSAGISGVEQSSGSSVLVSSSHGMFQAIITPSCSALASVLAIICLAALVPGYGGGRRLGAAAAAVGVVVAGNVVRIAGSLAVGLAAGRASLVLFHDSVGNIFSFAYTLGGYILMLWLLLPAEEPTVGALDAAG
jgi:exosortase/archaeosortase family protein